MRFLPWRQRQTSKTITPEVKNIANIHCFSNTLILVINREAGRADIPRYKVSLQVNERAVSYDDLASTGFSPQTLVALKNKEPVNLVTVSGNSVDEGMKELTVAIGFLWDCPLPEADVGKVTNQVKAAIEQDMAAHISQGSRSISPRNPGWKH